MKKIFLSILLFLFLINCYALTSDEILVKVKELESNLTSVQANLSPTGNKNKVAKLGKSMDLLAEIKNGSFKYKKGNRIKIEGKIQGVKVSAIENNYVIKYNLGMLHGTMDHKDNPGKRYNSLDLTFLSSWLWKNNKVTVLGIKNNIATCKFDPIQGGDEDRYDLVWIDVKTLKLIKRQKYNTDGILKYTFVYHEWKEMIPGYYISTKYTSYNGNNEELGINNIVNLKINKDIPDSTFNVN